LSSVIDHSAYHDPTTSVVSVKADAGRHKVQIVKWNGLNRNCSGRIFDDRGRICGDALKAFLCVCTGLYAKNGENQDEEVTSQPLEALSQSLEPQYKKPGKEQRQCRWSRYDRGFNCHIIHDEATPKRVTLYYNSRYAYTSDTQQLVWRIPG